MVENPFESDFSGDLEAIHAYNQRKGESSEYFIRTEVRPAIYEGRIGAPVTWLLSNPGFAVGASDAYNHPPPLTDGWPLQSLAPAHRNDYGKWTWDRLRELREIFGDQHVSESVLALQLCPWASAKFDDSLKLPSRQLARRIALYQMQTGSQFVLVRSEAAWRNLVPELVNVVLARTVSQRSAHLSRNNLREHWNLVHDAVKPKTRPAERVER